VTAVATTVLAVFAIAAFLVAWKTYQVQTQPVLLLQCKPLTPTNYVGSPGMPVFPFDIGNVSPTAVAIFKQHGKKFRINGGPGLDSNTGGKIRCAVLNLSKTAIYGLSLRYGATPFDPTRGPAYPQLPFQVPGDYTGSIALRVDGRYDFVMQNTTRFCVVLTPPEASSVAVPGVGERDTTLVLDPLTASIRLLSPIGASVKHIESCVYDERVIERIK
jgi:hypothetical protein